MVISNMRVKLFSLLLLAGYVNAQIFNLTVEYVVQAINEGISRALSRGFTPENAYEYKPTNQGPTVYGTFDYIIIGAGTTGSVLATRLSEDPNLKILVIEAGGHEDSFSVIPEMSVYLQGLRFNWNFKSVPQNTCCLAMVNRRCSLPRGKVLGGSSSINAMMYVRGNRKDYDHWEEQGNPGWSYKDVLPYFIKSENSQIDGDQGYHGKGGLWNVEYHRPSSPQFYAFVEANRELGRQTVDYNGQTQLGVSRIQQSTLNGRRASAATAFLAYAANRQNLHVLTNAFVTKILISDRKEAYGVAFTHSGKLYTAKASREIILSAGTFQSPQLLMLSGIGSGNHLEKFRIPIVQDLPGVGNNYQDHVTYYGLYFTTNYSERVVTDWERAAEYVKGYGPLTVSQSHQGISFYQTNSSDKSGVPDIEMLMLPSNSTNDYLQRAFDYTNETYENVFAKIDRRNTFCIYIILLHPKSKGTVRLKSASPFEYPSIDARYFSDPNNEDIETMYRGIQLALNLAETNALKKLNTSLFHAPLPACRDHKYLSKAYWYCQIRHISMANYHPVGTCKMGPDPKKGAVVDNQLKVHGITKLRVADASVFPSIQSGHTAAAAVMVGEKLSDMLKNNYS